MPLKRPLSGRASRSVREGLLLEQAGQWAEASPLPGFSRESLDDVIADLRDQRRALPSLCFALDALAWPTTALSVPINALLDHHDAEARAEELSQTAISTVKLKVGRLPLAEEVTLVRSVRQRLRDDQQLRLDANRAWNFDQACEFGRHLEGLSIAYVEEPLERPDRLEEFWSITGLPYALDETLSEAWDLQQFPHASAVVFKPTMLGGRDRVRQLVQWNKPIVFSAAFESGVGIARVAQLAAEFSPHVPAGLDTYAWLGKDVLMQPLTFVEGRLEWDGQWQIQRDTLEELVQ